MHGQADQIRQLAAKNWEIEAIAAEVGQTPSKVRRVLGRSHQRGAPRKRASSEVLSCATTSDVAATVRQLASERGIPVSKVLDELVRKGMVAEPETTEAAGREEQRTPPRASASIRLAEHLELDRRAATQKFGIIARSEAGKTYLAGKLVEGLHAIGCQVIVFDYVGNWWGLTLAANGRDPGLPFVVFGGRRAHLPLSANSGRRIARLVVERHLSVVLDLSGLRKRRRPGRGGEPESEFQRFVADFEEEALEASQGDPKPRMVVYDEAHQILPQIVKDGGSRMLDAGEDLIRTGRNHGWGCVQMSQRPQSINKEVLSQVECFFVGQLTEAPARARLKEWIIEKNADVKGELDELAKLQRGEFFCWSPQWLRVFKRIRVLPKWTFDASRTPELGETNAPGEPRRSGMSASEIETLRALLEEAPAVSAKHGNFAPGVETRARLRVLEAELASVRSELAERDERLAQARGDLQSVLQRLSVGGLAASLQPASDGAARRPGRARVEKSLPAREDEGGQRRRAAADAPPALAAAPTRTDGVDKCQRAIMTVLIQQKRPLSTKRLAMMAVYAPASGGFKNALSKLRGRAWIEGRGDASRTTRRKAADSRTRSRG